MTQQTQNDTDARAPSLEAKLQQLSGNLTPEGISQPRTPQAASATDVIL